MQFFVLRSRLARLSLGLMGSAHQLTEFNPYLASICYPFLTLLKKSERFKWTTEHDNAFARLKESLISRTP